MPSEDRVAAVIRAPLRDEAVRAMRRAVREAAVITVITAVTALAGVVQLLHPSLVTSWRRDTSALHSGQWWRLVTPMLVQGSGLFQYAYNLAGSALVGPSVERRYGARAVLVLYLAGGFAGIGLEYVLRPDNFGSGSSDAVAALIGALWWSAFTRRRPVPTPAAVYAAYFAVSLLALRFGGPIGSTVVGAALAASVTTLVRRHGPPVLTRLMLIAIPGPTLVLVVLLDGHGVGIAVGATLGAVLARHAPAHAHPTQI